MRKSLAPSFSQTRLEAKLVGLFVISAFFMPWALHNRQEQHACFHRIPVAAVLFIDAIAYLPAVVQPVGITRSVS